MTLHDLFTVCPLFFRLREDRELCAPEVSTQTCAACVAKAAGLPADSLSTVLPERSRRYRAELDAAHAVATLSTAQTEYLGRVPALAGLEFELASFPTLDGLEPLEPSDRQPGPLRIATWGGLARGKGLHLLVEAARMLPPGSVELHHHGPIFEEDYAREIRAAAGELSLTLHGKFEPAELRERLRHIDLAVHPSLFLETYGFTTDEALHFGIPVLVPDRGAPAERIGTRGATFRVNDATDLARALRELIEDPSRLTAFRNGKPGKWVTWAQHTGDLRRLYS